MTKETWSDTFSMPKFMGMRKQAEVDCRVYDFSDAYEKKHEKVRKLNHRPKKSHKWNQPYRSLDEIIEDIAISSYEILDFAA